MLKYLLAAGLSCLLMACGDQAENQGGTAQPAAQAQANDPRYANALLNANPAQFNEILADCGKLLFGEHAAPDEVKSKCYVGMAERAQKLGLKISEADINEPLVKERYRFTLRETQQK
ncbi:hypothetical protein [Chitinibacter sp. ZOR0017]|uniref:hypothetical protein n=1 Tax=Chitinibacter sp. ZOR0017 TaxID=1339254 RepID=UPI0006460CCF|nr:hypothetical protein [Chitinibacter sp. ZOR0017]